MNRIPYFALLGQNRSDFQHKTQPTSPLNQELDDNSIKKKFSILSQYSFLSTSPSSLFRSDDDSNKSSKIKQIKTFSTTSSALSACSSSLIGSTSLLSSRRSSCSNNNFILKDLIEKKCDKDIVVDNFDREQILKILKARQLTIFAIAEVKSMRLNEALKVHERNYNGVDVIYTHDHIDSQPLLG